jgi:V8-like Glu-specific endopeptidase
MKTKLSIFLILFLATKTCGQKEFAKKIDNYCYPLYVYEFDKIGMGSCFFVKYDSASYLITAAHNFIRGGKVKQIQGISVFINPSNKGEKGWEISPKDLFILNSHYPTGELVDVVAIPLDATQKRINYVDIGKESDVIDTTNGSKVSIAGYPSDSFEIVTTKIAMWGGMGPIFFTEKPSNGGASGGPVFVTKRAHEQFAGVYVGRRTDTNRGIVIKAGLLFEILKSHKKY